MKLIYLFLIAFFTGFWESKQNVTVDNLRCEYLEAPLGIDIAKPRFSWELVATSTGFVQQAYRIQVSARNADFEDTSKLVWDSGKVISGTTNQVHYEGINFEPHTYYYWRVAIWDHEGTYSGWSEPARFSTGPLSQSDWTAEWIGDLTRPIKSDEIYYPHPGYKSAPSTSAESPKWITIDLAHRYQINKIELHPIHKEEKLFPLRYTIEISDDSLFSNSHMLIDETLADVTLKEGEIYKQKVTHAAIGRYIRLKTDQLPTADGKTFAFGLSEIKVFEDDTNVAQGKKVVASDITLGWTGAWQYEASFLTDGYLRPDEKKKYSDEMPPSPLLRKEIEINKPVSHAFLYTSALGIYEAYINGEKVGDQILAPEWTDYDSHVQYQTHEVSHMLTSGANAIGAMLADGWYAGPRWSHPHRGGYGFFRQFIAQLVVFYEDGTNDVFGTDESWKYLESGPITHATNFSGEIYEAKYEQPGWDKPKFDDSGWIRPGVYPWPETTVRAQMNEPVKIIDKIKAVSVHQIADDTYIFDLGQNIAGWCELSLPYNPGGAIRLTYGEVLNEDSTLYTENLREATQIDYYHPAGESQISYEPRFTYHGFRFVEIKGLSKTPELANVVGKMVASSSPITGKFETSNDDINKLWENIRWTQWGNLISVPTDCPQRDERDGWMGDAQLFSQTAIYNLDMAAFYTKWMRDVRDSQLEDGRFPDVAPHDGLWRGVYGAPGWADAGVIIPWRVYQNYGDKDLLATQYESMKRFINFVETHNPGMLWRNMQGRMYGDWLNGNTIIADDYPKTGGQVPNDVFATGYWAYSTGLLAKTAKVLGKEHDHIRYNKLASEIKKTFVDSFVNEQGVIQGNTQAGYAMALEFGLLPEHLREKAATRMVEAVRAYDYRISTGIHSTVWLMNQLTEYGYSDLAYQLLLSRRFPSWFYSIDQGATTIWERWDGFVAGRGFQNPGMNSFNHVAIGAVGEWMYHTILGIRLDESNAGYQHFAIRPVPGGNLDWARGSYHSIAGPIAVSWTNRGDDFNLEVEVPANTRATVTLPLSKKTVEVGSGKHRFTDRKD